VITPIIILIHLLSHLLTISPVLYFGHVKVDSVMLCSVLHPPGVADKNDDLAFQELLQCHPVSDSPACSAPKCFSLVVDESAVLVCL